MGSFCTSGNTVNQSQTYTPNPYAFGAISNALQQGQQVAQTPFQTPVAPVAGFSNDQNQAFQGTRNAQGMAQPYIDQAQNYFAGNNVSQFYNPMAANVMAGLKDVFGEQQQQITGNLQQQAGGVGADRIAIGQADLAKQQGLAAGQTLSGLYQNALQASQNAGFGIGALGPVAQNAALQGSQALLGTGGLQQQLQQAQMNAPYQNQLARIQWPYQNAQFNANITGALAPGLGGTTAGQTTYPQQSPLGTIAGLGMAGAGIAGQAGMFGGLGNMYNGYNYDGSMSGAQWAAAGQGQGPYAAQARGGRINPYASGGGVDDGDDAIHSAEVKELQDEGNQSNGFHMPQGGGGVHPINVAAQSLIPSGQVAQIKPNIPQLPNPSQSGSGGGSGGMMGNLASIAKGAAAIAPFFLARGGAVDGYAEGGGTNPFDPSGWAPAPEMPEEGESFGHFFMKANPFEMAMRGLKPSGIRLAPNANPARDPTFQVRGRFTRHGDTAPLMRHPGNPACPGACRRRCLACHSPTA